MNPQYYIVLEKMRTPSEKYLLLAEGDVVKKVGNSKAGFIWVKDMTSNRVSPIKVPISNLLHPATAVKCFKK